MNVAQVFGIIFAIIVIAFVLVFGTGAIGNIFCVGNVATMDNSVQQLKTTLGNVYLLAEGSTDIYAIKVPQGSKVCFVNPESPDINPLGGWLPPVETRNITLNNMRRGGYNVWIDYNCGTQSPYYKINYMKPKQNFCLTGNANLYLENKGLWVEVSKQ
jgi:hypothetical protein